MAVAGLGSTAAACSTGAGPEASPSPVEPEPPIAPGAGSTPGVPEDAVYTPGASWETVTAADAGWDPAALDEVVAFAGSHATKSLLLVVGGRILVEHHFGVDPSFRREVASCQKSVVAVLVGMAVERSLLSLDDAVSDHLGPGWSAAGPGPEGSITVRHLVSMTSGLDPRLQVVAPPGEVWSYNNAAYHQVQPVLEAATGRSIGALSDEWLWSPIGATASSWYERPGDGAESRDSLGNRLWGLIMSARDMARFGLLVERAGSFGEGRVFDPSVFLEDALTSSSDQNPSYGYLWWLNGQEGFRLGPAGDLQPGPLIPHAPDDLVAALGKDDQKIYVSRSQQIVLVRQGDRAGSRSLETMSSFDDELWTRVTAARA